MKKETDLIHCSGSVSEYAELVVDIGFENQ